MVRSVLVGPIATFVCARAASGAARDECAWRGRAGRAGARGLFVRSLGFVHFVHRGCLGTAFGAVPASRVEDRSSRELAARPHIHTYTTVVREQHPGPHHTGVAV